MTTEFFILIVACRFFREEGGWSHPQPGGPYCILLPFPCDLLVAFANLLGSLFIAKYCGGFQHLFFLLIGLDLVFKLFSFFSFFFFFIQKLFLLGSIWSSSGYSFYLFFLIFVQVILIGLNLVFRLFFLKKSIISVCVCVCGNCSKQYIDILYPTSIPAN